MKNSVRTKLETLAERYQEIGALMSDGDIISDQTKFRALAQEYAEIEPVVKCFEQYDEAQSTLEDAKSMLEEMMRKCASLLKKSLNQAQY